MQLLPAAGVPLSLYQEETVSTRSIKQFKQRDDVFGDGHAPKDIQQALAKAGGLTPYREPKYRLVLAQNVREWHGGEFLDWPTGATLQEQGGLVFTGTQKKQHHIELPDKNIPESARRMLMDADVPILVPSEVKPIRRFVGMRLCKRYPTIKGWILQMWRPAKHFGRRVIWESFIYNGNPEILMLGPFPEKGAYEIAGERIERGPDGVLLQQMSWPEIPAIGLLEDMIQFLECERMTNYAASPEARIAIRLHEYQQRMLAQEEKEKEEQLQSIRDYMKPIMGSSLAAGRMREELAKKAGISEHVGN